MPSSTPEWQAQARNARFSGDLGASGATQQRHRRVVSGNRPAMRHLHDRHRYSERFHPARQVTMKPSRRPSRQRRDDDLGKSVVADQRLDSVERVFSIAHDALHWAAGGPPQQWQRGLQRPVGRPPVDRVGDQQAELATPSFRAPSHLLQQARR
jgi:hypothetical protein